MSSKPVTETSSGTRRPASVAARTAPSAVRSAAVTIAVGGSGQREQLAGRAIAALDVEVAVGDVLVARRSARAPAARGGSRAGGRRPGVLSSRPVIVAIRRCPSPCRWRTASAAPPSLSEHDVARRRPLELDVDADGGHVGAHEPAHLGVVGVEAHEHGAVDVVVAAALEVGVGAEAVAGALAGEQQQVVAGAADEVLDPRRGPRGRTGAGGPGAPRRCRGRRRSRASAA